MSWNRNRDRKWTHCLTCTVDFNHSEQRHPIRNRDSPQSPATAWPKCSCIQPHTTTFTCAPSLKIPTLNSSRAHITSNHVFQRAAKHLKLNTNSLNNIQSTSTRVPNACKNATATQNQPSPTQTEPSKPDPTQPRAWHEWWRTVSPPCKGSYALRKEATYCWRDEMKKTDS